MARRKPEVNPPRGTMGVDIGGGMRDNILMVEGRTSRWDQRGGVDSPARMRHNGLVDWGDASPTDGTLAVSMLFNKLVLLDGGLTSIPHRGIISSMAGAVASLLLRLLP